MPNTTHYHTLGVSPRATAAEIRAAYRRLARQHHPDLGDGDGAALREIIAAYTVLSDPDRRGRYDQELAARGPAASAPPHPARGGEMPEKARTMDVGVVLAPHTFSQLGVLVLDGSGSMSEAAMGKLTKAQAVNGAVREMLTRFSVSRHKRNFSFAVVTFDEEAAVHTPVTPATEINDNADYDPMRNHGGGTSIGAGLAEARRVAEEFLRQAPDDIPSSVVIVVMSDGRDGEGVPSIQAETLRVADDIKGNPAVTICTTYFAGVAGPDAVAQDHLRALASYPATGFKTVYDAETLRKFFIASVSAGTNLVIA